MTAPSLVKSFANKIYKAFSDDTGKLLLWTGTVGWILSSIAQLSGVITNKNISDDQKKFLIPQEIFDAVINIASFFIVTKTCTDIGKKLVKSGKLTTNIIKNLLTKEEIAKIGTKDLNISALDRVKNETDIKLTSAYGEFSNGIGFVFSTIGSIISSNIITPILRNKIASARQKDDIAKEKGQQQTLSPYSPTLPMQNKSGSDDYRAKTMPTTGGNMKI